MAKQIDLPGAYILGAGAVSHRSVGMNAEVSDDFVWFNKQVYQLQLNWIAFITSSLNVTSVDNKKKKSNTYNK